jgi:hypothetical protein
MFMLTVFISTVQSYLDQLDNNIRTLFLLQQLYIFWLPHMFRLGVYLVNDIVAANNENND